MRASDTRLNADKLLTLNEVAAMLDLAPATIHRLPLACIRLGRQLRFDPKDVRQLIKTSKEPVLD